MPSSRPTTVPVVIHLLRQIRPQSILDVGVGFGKWGHLFREYTDINEAELDPARYQRAHWKVRIDGIEGYAPYITEMHRFLYNEIHLGDARSLLPRLPRYDLIFLGDIIEHFDKPAGVELLHLAVAHANKAVIVSTPKYETDQPDLCGNELERHRSLWSPHDFRQWPGAQTKTVDGETLVVVVSRPGQPPLSFTSKRSDPAALSLLREARAELIRLIDTDEAFILIDEEQLRCTLPHRAAQPFLERDGTYWGPPGDDTLAVSELDRMRHAGARRVAFVSTTFWWLDHYSALKTHLETDWHLIHNSAALRIYAQP
jgi:hypothetical protein